jgi:hypothetical protein
MIGRNNNIKALSARGDYLPESGNTGENESRWLTSRPSI